LKSLWNSFGVAFSLYSILPAPRVEWQKENLRYALCFFPLIGVVIGALQWGWFLLARQLGLVPALFGAVAVLLPILISGGIHMDGWMDTVDALASRAEPEKKRQILKDPHVGAFGVLGCVLYLLLQWGLWQQIYQTPGLILWVCWGYILSRSLNAESIVSFPTAAQSGIVHTFKTSASRISVMVAISVMCIATLLPFIQSVRGHSFGLLVPIFMVYFYFFHKRMCMRQFGGNSGDLAGFLLQNIELWCLIAAAIGGIMI